MKDFIKIFICYNLMSCTLQTHQNSNIKLINKYPVLDITELKKTNDSLYCLNDSVNCNIIDGSVILYSNYNKIFTENIENTPYLFAKGEFLEGKYDGIWTYYDKNEKVIKKEKWDNGKLIYRKEYK